MSPQRTVLAVAVALAASAVPATAPSPASASGPPVVRVAEGALRGSAEGGVVTFRGVPYAAPPVGDLRWRSPRPAVRWTGVRVAVEPGARCPQRDAATGRVGGAEDCLYLSVQAPARPRGRVPVVVFLHGGGFTGGSGADHDASRLVRQGGVAVVTVNYRLGALGFLGHSADPDPAAGNYGLADQQAAVRWVRANIGAFGGDPGAVTLWGQSAGAFSVCAQLASPAARGLFRRAIVQSGPCGNAMLSRPAAGDRATALASSLGCDTLACLRVVPAEVLVARSPSGPRLPVRSVDRPWLPVVGTPLLPEQPGAGTRPGIAVLRGGTRDEMAGFVAGSPPTDYADSVRAVYGPDADSVLQRYPASAYPTPATALATVLSDDGSFLGACRQNVGPTDYAYEFAEPSGALGAYHTTDLRYLLDSRDEGPYAPPPLTDAERPLADTMVRHWVAFVRTGRPAPGWPAHGTGRTLRFTGDGTSVVDAGAEHGCDFWRSVHPV